MNRNNNNSDNSYYPNAKRQRKQETNNWNVKPSFVVHARNLVDGITESQVGQALEKYGNIVDIFLLPKKRQGLIQYDDIDSAMASVEDSNENGIYISGLQCYLNYSTGQKIMRPTDFDEKRVLNINVMNPLYPITIGVMQKICASFGKILRMMIFRKNGVQVMVEFDTGDSASKAKEALEGADIYSGCCTLSIDYAKTSRLNVLNNDADGIDFTVNEQNSKSDNHSNRYDNNNGHRDQNESRGNKQNISSLMSLTETSFQPNDAPNNHSNQGLGGQIVLSAHNLCPERFNCDKLFNLLSLYGNVDKIKFLLSKEGSAMLQMSNAKPLHDAIVHLNNTFIFERKIQIHVGKQAVLNPVTKPINLKDETSSYKEYMTCRNNRYQTVEAAQKNKPLPPSNVLYWYNAPPGVSEENITDVFESCGATAPSKVKIFPKKVENKTSTGLVEWNDVSKCVESLVLTNHTEINHPSSKFPYIFKLCFSGTPISRENNNGGTNNNNNNSMNKRNYDNNNGGHHDRKSYESNNYESNHYYDNDNRDELDN